MLQDLRTAFYVYSFGVIGGVQGEDRFKGEDIRGEHFESHPEKIAEILGSQVETQLQKNLTDHQNQVKQQEKVEKQE